MPYNLRKRKTVEPVNEEPIQNDNPPAKKKRRPAKEEQAAKEKPAKKSEPIIKKEKVVKKRVTKKEAVKKVEEKEVEEKVKEEEVIEQEDENEIKPIIVEKPILKEEIKQQIKTQLVFGEDSCGEFGLGRIGITKKKPTKVLIDTHIEQVACGPMHTLSLTCDGQVYSYGCNDEGALGRVTDGDETLEATPTIVPIKNKVIKVTAGDSHSAALTKEQEVFVWGNFRDEHGPIGLTPSLEGKSVLHPIQILPDIKFKDIASGSNHMLLLDNDGSVYSFGVGAQGQLGRITADDVGQTGKTIPITADNRGLFLKPQIVNLKNVDPQRPFVCDAIYAGNSSSFATNTDKKKNRLAGWGLNNYFQLGYKGLKAKNGAGDAFELVQHSPKRSTFTCSTSIKGVACGPHHTIFLTKTGRCYAAGRNEYGMLGLPKVGKEVCPAKSIDSLGNSIVNISAGINTSFAVSEEAKLYAWGMGGLSLGSEEGEDLLEPTQVKCLEDKKVVSVSTGGTFTSVIVNE